MVAFRPDSPLTLKLWFRKRQNITIKLLFTKLIQLRFRSILKSKTRSKYVYHARLKLDILSVLSPSPARKARADL